MGLLGALQKDKVPGTEEAQKEDLPCEERMAGTLAQCKAQYRQVLQLDKRITAVMTGKSSGDLVALRAKRKKQYQTIVNGLAELSNEEWAVYQGLRKADDKDTLARFEASTVRLKVPDGERPVVLRTRIRSRLQYATPLYEADAELLRRSR